MRNSSSCKAVLHAGGTAHPCTGEHPQPEVHESESGYRWTSYGKVLARPQADES